MLIHELIGVAAHNARPDSYIHADDQRLTFPEFATYCHRFSQALLGLASVGSRVAVLSANRLEFLAAYIGVPGAGMVMTPLNTRLGPRELAHILDDAEPAVLMIEALLLPTMLPLLVGRTNPPMLVVIGMQSGESSALPAHALVYEEWLEAAVDRDLPLLSEGDPAWLFYTSGTTGLAKGALLSHRNIIASATNSMCEIEFSRNEVVLFFFPMFHIAGYILLTHMLRGDSVVLMRSFEVKAYLGAVQQHRITCHAIAPTMLAMVLDDPCIDDYDTSSLRFMIYGASAMPAQVIRAAMARWPNVGFSTSFGMTELAGIVLYLGRNEHLLGQGREPDILAACGTPTPLARVRLVNDLGQDVSAGEEGELAVLGDQVFMGYWRNDAATASSFLDGWFLTGDIGRRDVSGRVYIVDRKKDMIISGGENIYSREIENLLYEHPAVAEVAVVGEPHRTWGEQVVAIVRLREPIDLADAVLNEFCKGRIGGYKRPRRYVFLEELPKNPSGKILKAVLRQQLSTGKFTLQSLGDSIESK